MADIFISHIREEAEVAKAIRRCILKDFPNQFEVFMSSDKRQMLAGEIWLERIRRELESSKVVVLLLSANSLERPWVNFEAGAAWLTNKAIIPICFGGLRKKDLPKPYSDIQAVKLPRDSYYLMLAIAARLGAAPPARPTSAEPRYEKIATSIGKLLKQV